MSFLSLDDATMFNPEIIDMKFTIYAFIIDVEADKNYLEHLTFLQINFEKIC